MDLGVSARDAGCGHARRLYVANKPHASLDGASDTGRCCTDLTAALLNTDSGLVEFDEGASAAPSGWSNVELRSYRVSLKPGADFCLRFELQHRVAASGTAKRGASRGPGRPRLQTAAEVLERASQPKL